MSALVTLALTLRREVARLWRTFTSRREGITCETHRTLMWKSLKVWCLMSCADTDVV